MFKAFTDGSSRGNPGPGGWGVILISEDRVQELGGREEKTTNNRMEMRAVIEAIRHAPHEDVEVFTDSAYLVNGATKWIAGWKARGWKTITKQDVLNKDLWLELDAELSKKRVVLHIVPGHSGVPLNERADVIATSFADNEPTALFNGKLSEYPISFSFDVPYQQSSVKRGRSGAAYSYISLVDGVIQTHRTWSECEARVKGKKNVRFKKALTPEEEREIIEDFKK